MKDSVMILYELFFVIHIFLLFHTEQYITQYIKHNHDNEWYAGKQQCILENIKA